MAFAKIPKNINQIETKLIGNLTKRQIITIIVALSISIPIFYFTYKVNINLALYALFFSSFPIFFVGFYKKNGEYIDYKIIKYVNRNLLNKKIRVYENETYIFMIERIYYGKTEKNKE